MFINLLNVLVIRLLVGDIKRFFYSDIINLSKLNILFVVVIVNKFDFEYLPKLFPISISFYWIIKTGIIICDEDWVFNLKLKLA